MSQTHDTNNEEEIRFGGDSPESAPPPKPIPMWKPFAKKYKFERNKILGCECPPPREEDDTLKMDPAEFYMCKQWFSYYDKEMSGWIPLQKFPELVHMTGGTPHRDDLIRWMCRIDQKGRFRISGFTWAMVREMKERLTPEQLVIIISENFDPEGTNWIEKETLINILCDPKGGWWFQDRKKVTDMVTKTTMLSEDGTKVNYPEFIHRFTEVAKVNMGRKARKASVARKKREGP